MDIISHVTGIIEIGISPPALNARYKNHASAFVFAINPVHAIRPCNIYGPLERAIETMMQRIILTSQRRALLTSAASSASAASRPAASSTTRSFSAAVVEEDPNDGRFSIQGTFREGRASYLDMSATTPMDPRVLDKMMPFMVSKNNNSSGYCI